MPRVTVSIFGSKKCIQETTIHPLSVPSYEFQSDPQRESYDDFPQVTCLECNSGVCKKTNFLRSYLRKYRAKSSKIWTQGSAWFLLKWVFLWLLKHHRKKGIAKMPRWPVWSSETLESKRPASSDHISQNIAWKALKFGPKVQRDVFSNGFFFLTSESSQKKSYSENATMTCLEQRNPRIQSSDTKCYETSSRKDRKYRSTP